MAGIFPSNMSKVTVPCGPDGIEMAGSTCHTGVGIMGDTFIMGRMALPAISPRLSTVAELRAFGMAYHAGHVPMGGRFVLGLINQRK